MIYIFNGDEVEEHKTWPLNPQYPLGTWGCIKDGQGGVKWYSCSKGTYETFWAHFQVHKVPKVHRLQLLIMGPPK